MTKHTYSATSSSRPYATSHLGRADITPDDDRPFAEIRKNLNDVLRMVSLHRWMFFVPFSLVTSAAFTASLYYPRVYRASTTFERRNDPVLMNLPMSAGAASFQFFRDTMSRDVTSTEAIGSVVEKLNLIPDLERDANGRLTPQSLKKRNQLARSLARTLDVTMSSPTDLLDVITLSYTGPDPELGRKLVDEAKHAYTRRTTKWIHKFLVDQRDYFEAEAQRAQERLNTARRKETQLRMGNPHIDPTNPGAIALRISQLEMERRELSMRERDYEEELSALRQMRATIEPDVAGAPAAEPGGAAKPAHMIHPDLVRCRERIAVIDSKIRALRETRGMTDQHPRIQELLADRRVAQEEFDRLNERLGGGTDDAADATLASTAPPLPRLAEGISGDRARLMVQTAAQEAKLRDIRISLKANQEALNELLAAKAGVFQQQEQHAAVANEVARAKQEYTRLAKTVTEIDPLIEAIEQERAVQFSEGYPARGSHIPVSPDATTIILLALAAGLAAGIVFVILAELFDHVYRGAAQVSRSLGLPILESIDEIVTAQDRRRNLIQKAVVGPAAAVCCAGITLLSGSMAYLSVAEPSAYQRIRKIPRAVTSLFVDTGAESGR